MKIPGFSLSNYEDNVISEMLCSLVFYMKFLERFEHLLHKWQLFLSFTTGYSDVHQKHHLC